MSAWKEFRKGKRLKPDVRSFEFNLEDNIFQLHNDLVNGNWRPEPYTSFFVRDPKLRHIHKATVRDRVFNQAVFRVLYPIFNKTFIHDSYSSRIGKGTHNGVNRLVEYTAKITQNHTRRAFALKCDIRKFFDNISHEILIKLIRRKVKDESLMKIILLIINSFETELGKGLPLGNVTSQLFANIYLNELDQYVKHILNAKYYERYCDDFIILKSNKQDLFNLIPSIRNFLKNDLDLELHPNKISVRKIIQGVDFLGYVALPHYRVLRTKTKNRIIRKVKNLKMLLKQNKITKESYNGSSQSYLGILKHCKGKRIEMKFQL